MKDKKRVVVVFNEAADVKALQNELQQNGVKNQELLEILDIIVGEFDGDIEKLRKIKNVRDVSWETMFRI